MRRNHDEEPFYEEELPTRRYIPAEEPDDSPYRIEAEDGEPYENADENAPYPGGNAPYDDGNAPYASGNAPYADGNAPYPGDEPYDQYGGSPDDAYDGYEDEYTDEDIEQESAHRMRVAMSALDVFGVVAGCVCIFVLVSLLISLFNWLIADVTHGLSLFGMTLQ